MSEYPGSFREIPLWVFIILPIFFIAVVLFTDIKYTLRPKNYIGHSTVIASLVIGFIFLYTMQKFDLMDLNVPIVTRNLVYLKSVAEKYDPSLVKYLVSYSEGFLDFDMGNYSMYIFEQKLLDKITDKNLKVSVIESCKILKDVYDQRISGTNLIAQPIWYLVIIVCILLTLIFPLDDCFQQKADSVIVILLIWLPVVTMYALYLSEVNSLINSIKAVILVLKSKKLSLSNVPYDRNPNKGFF
jgi:hypothetical protein